MLCILLFGLILTVTAVSCGDVNVFDMGSGEVRSLAVTGCNYRICPVRNGETYRVNLTFVANQNSNTLSGFTWAFINGTSTALTNVNYDGCSVDENSWLGGGGCPLRKGRTYSIIRIWTGAGLIPGTEPVIIGQWFGDRGQILYEAAKFTAVD